jgi:cell pole-organizing protein PopZ
MSDTNQEPTMEEILASIRRIISEDEAPQDEAATTPPATVEAAPEPFAEAAPAPEPEPEPYVAAAVEADAGDEVLDLTERVEAAPEAAAPVESLGDLDVFSQPAPRAPEPAAEPAWAPAAESDSLVSAPAARSAASSFDQLASSLIMPREGRTLEDVVQELLRPLLKSWLDENLPEIVQAKVDAEVERIARSRVR